MKVMLKKYGNSTGFVIPANLVRDLGLSAGEELTLTLNEERDIVLSRQKKKRKYTLDSLLAQCDLSAPRSTYPDLEQWNDMKPAGQEVW